MKDSGLSNFLKVYDLKEDKRRIKLIQDATLNSWTAGLKKEHGLFASDKWWSAIEDGRTPKISLEGIISRVYMSGHNDFPEFELTSESGRRSFERFGEDRYYIVGKKIKVIYVIQKHKFLALTPKSEILLEVWIEK